VPDDGSLKRYRQKRDFSITSEPPPGKSRRSGHSYVIQKHWARRLHYDFRLELGGVLLSWAVPKGPSTDPAVKRLAVRTEDHPVSYGGFEGTIPHGQYGAGKVEIWDRGQWEPLGDARAGLRKGKLAFRLKGERLQGTWELVRMRGEGKAEPWLLFHKREAATVRAEAPAPRAALPPSLSPQLATLASSVPAEGEWIAEHKYDGYRLLARVERGKARLFTRNGHDWTAKLGGLGAEVAALPLKSGWLDGEITLPGGDDMPDFNALQNAIGQPAAEAIRFHVFDVPFLDGKDLRAQPLTARRARLEALFAGRKDSDRVQLSPVIDAAPQKLLEAACRLKLEGIILKRADSPYVSRRSDAWLKLKCQQRQEFVVVGFLERTNARAEVGSLLLAVHEQDRLRFVGAVGTGWDAKTGRELHRQLTALKRSKAAINPADVEPGRWPRRAAGEPKWVQPKLVVEVSFGEWTPEGRIRHASFKGLREDKPARQITRESAAKPKITHPERVVDSASNLRKRDVVNYYEDIAPRMLPHLRDRPVSLLRAPQGVKGKMFFQKHAATPVPGVRQLDQSLWPKHAPLLAIDSAEALVSAAQMNVIEFHTWNSTVSHIDRPDRVVFDLDPGEGVRWKQVSEAALLTRALLQELGLESWLKSSGGKGLHVVVPLAPRESSDAVKALARSIVQHMAGTIPQRFVARSGAANRVGRIFVDYLRNGFGQTTVAAFSARARPGMGVSMPMDWDELPEIRSGAEWTLATAAAHLRAQAQDPWRQYWKMAQTLATARRKLGVN